jgi:hydroxyacylglutathione hydrolase
MEHVVTKPSAPFPSASGKLEIHQVPAWQDNLIWLVVSTATGAGAAVDGPEAGPVLAYCEAHGIELTTIVNTHTHFDHIGINRDLHGRGLLGGMRVVGPKRAAGDVPGLTEPVDEGSRVELGGVAGRVMLTEGHIDGHVSFVFEDVLFCGDTLFAGGCGYLFDGPPAKMHDSLTRLAALDGPTRVCCAHEYTEDNLRFAWSVEPDNEDLALRIRNVWRIRSEGGSTVPSTIDEERRTNPFLRHGSPTVKASVARVFPDVDTDDPTAVFAALRRLKDQKTYRQLGDDRLPL